MADGSLSQFKATLARKKERKEKANRKFGKSRLGYNTKNSSSEFNFTKVSDSNLKTIKASIKKKANKQKRQNFIVFLLIFISLSALILYLF